MSPTLAIAQELVRRGQYVIYYLPEPFQDAVQATGAVFRHYDSKLMKNVHPNVMVEECHHVLPQVLDRIRVEQPDVIVYEASCLWARIVIQVLKMPAIHEGGRSIPARSAQSRTTSWSHRTYPNSTSCPARVFVTHGGMNSVMESLYYGVPMVALPQMGDQPMTAQRIAEMGLGIALDKEAVNVTTLREAVERVASEPAFRERTEQM